MRRHRAFRRIARSGCLATAIAAAIATSPISAKPAAGFCASDLHWPMGTGHQVWATSSIPAGFRGAVRNAVTGWNGIPGARWSFSYIGPEVPPGPITNGGQVIMNSNTAPYAGAPGVTLLRYMFGILWASDTFLNPAFSWNASGVMNQSQKKADVDTVTRHEMGHWLSLAHPGACGPMTQAEVDAVMSPTWTTKWSLNSDDRAGAAFMY